jgi:hypothetical protein
MSCPFTVRNRGGLTYLSFYCLKLDSKSTLLHILHFISLTLSIPQGRIQGGHPAHPPKIGKKYDFFWRKILDPPLFNISAISWRAVLVVEEAGVPGENHRRWASNW